MMPVATITHPEIPKAKRPKIGFSIDSIVGNCENKESSSNSSAHKLINSRSPSPITFHHNHHHHHHLNHSPTRSETSESSALPGSPIPSSTEQQSIIRHFETNSQNSSRSNSPNESKPLTSISNGPPPSGLPQFPQLSHHNLLNFGHPHHPGSLGPINGLPPWMIHGQSPHHPAGPGGPMGHPNPSHPMYPWFLARQSRFFPPRFGPGPEFPGFLLHPFRKPKRIRTAFSPQQLLKLEHAFEKNHYVVGAERKQLAKLLSLTETQVKVWFQNRRTKHKRVETDDEHPQHQHHHQQQTTGKGGSGHNNNNTDGGNSQSSSSALNADSSTSHHHLHSRKNYNDDSCCSDDDEDEEILMDETEHDDLCLSDEEAEQQQRRERERIFREQLQRNRIGSSST